MKHGVASFDDEMVEAAAANQVVARTGDGSGPGRLRSKVESLVV